MKHLFTTALTAVAVIAISLSSCSKDDDPKPNTNNTGNTGGSPQGGSGGNTTPPPPATNETVNYTVEFISGPRAGTKYSGSLEGFSYGGFSTTEDDVETLYTSFYHSDTIVIAANVVLDANGNAKPLNASYNDDSYVNISINPGSQMFSAINSQSGSCTITNITRGATHPASGDAEVKRAGFTVQFEGTFEENNYSTMETAEHTIRGTITTKLPK